MNKYIFIEFVQRNILSCSRLNTLVFDIDSAMKVPYIPKKAITVYCLHLYHCYPYCQTNSKSLHK